MRYNALTMESALCSGGIVSTSTYKIMPLNVKRFAFNMPWRALVKDGGPVHQFRTIYTHGC